MRDRRQSRIPVYGTETELTHPVSPTDQVANLESRSTGLKRLVCFQVVVFGEGRQSRIPVYGTEKSADQQEANAGGRSSFETSYVCLSLKNGRF